MTDRDMHAFEDRLAGVLRTYSAIEVRTVDAAAVAHAAVGARRRPALIAGRPIPATYLAAAFVLLLSLVAAALVIGALLQKPPVPVSGYEAIFLRASSETNVSTMDVVAVAGDGQERLLRRLDASLLSDGGTFSRYGSVSEDGWIAVDAQDPSVPDLPRRPTAAWALFDLRDDSRAPVLVPYTPVIGGAWGAGGRFATIRAGTSSGFEVQVTVAATGQTTQLGSLSLPGSGPDFVWAADGSGLLVSLVGEASGHGIASADGKSVIQGVPALTWRRGSRYVAEGGAELVRTDTAVTVQPPGGATTTWYSGDLAPATLADASFGADGRSVWLLLDRIEGDRHTAVVARADAPQQVTVVGTVDLGSDVALTWFDGLAPDDSSLVIGHWTGQLGGETAVAPPVIMALPRTGSSSSSNVHPGTFIGYVSSRALQESRQADVTPVHTDELVPAGDLATPRAGATVVELLDGRVLVVGGNADAETTAELFDPATGAHASTGPLVSAEALAISSAVRLRDGRVLLVGDARPFDAPFYGVAQVFDPATTTFTGVGPMLTPRAGAKLAMLPDGRVIMAGGTPPNDQNTALAAAEIFDPASATFTQTGPMATPRSMHALVALPGGGVLALGGETTYGESPSSLSSAELYDSATGTWSDAGSMSFAGSMSNLTGTDLAVALHGGRVVAFGVDEQVSVDTEGPPGPDARVGVADIWDPATRMFSRIATRLPLVAGALLLDDGRVFLTGTESRDASWAAVFDAAQAARDPTPQPLVAVEAPSAWGPVATGLSDGRVLLVGGLTDGNIRPENGGHFAPSVTIVEIFQ
jgi:hypothetical protein